MKLNFGKRMILFVYWLASLIVLASLALPEYFRIASDYVLGLLPDVYRNYALIALLAVYLLLSIGVLCMIFKRDSQKRSERGFITVDSADTGKVRIAMSAIEHMVKQAAYTVDGIADMKIAISNKDDAIAIQVNVTMVNGSHVPTVTLNMQRAIRQYVELNCGVAVQSVSISIQSVTNSIENSKRGKRADAKIAQPVQENKPEQPVSYTAPTSTESQYANSAAEISVKEEESVIAEPIEADTAAVTEMVKENVVVADDEQNEEENEN